MPVKNPEHLKRVSERAAEIFKSLDPKCTCESGPLDHSKDCNWKTARIRAWEQANEELKLSWQ